MKCTMAALSGLTALILSASSLLADTGGDQAFTPQFKPTIIAPHVNGEVHVDGDLSEPVWSQAVRAVGFCETSPGDQIAPGVKSEALIAYDQSNLYVALIAYDNPSDIRVAMRQRDQIFQDDYFGIMLDTYGDQTWGYELFVNPLGIQGDLRMQSNGYEDLAFDIVFESVGQVTDSGYQVEIAIPFASLRFPNQVEQNWRLNFWRDRQRDNRYRYAWSAVDRDNSCFVCQFGYLKGIRDIKPSSNIEILPNVTASQFGQREYWQHDATSFVNGDPDAELSLNARYGVTPNSSLELTINPDFSQVESDAGQIDVNTSFALSYPEKRPFFQEGADLFDTYIPIVHTRTINDPSSAARFTGQFGRTSVAYVFAVDETSTLILPFAEHSSWPLVLDRSYVNIFRLRQTFGEDSQIGVIATDRRMNDLQSGGVKHDGGSGSTVGLDGSIRLSRFDKISFIGVGSWTREPDSPSLYATSATFDNGQYTETLDGEYFRGHSIASSLEHSTDKLALGLQYTESTPTFRADNGRVRSNDRRDLTTWVQYNFRPNRKWILQIIPNVNIGRAWLFDGKIQLNPGRFDVGTEDEWISTNLYLLSRWQTQLNASYLYSRERYAGRVIPGISRVNFSLFTRPIALISGSMYMVYGNSIFRGDTEDPRLGQELATGVSATVRPTSRLLLSSSLDYARMNNRDVYMQSHPNAERLLYSGYILWNRLTYQFTRELYLRLIVQYNDFGEQFSVEPLITYQINPFTLFYVGMTSQYQQYRETVTDPNTDAIIGRYAEWAQGSRQFFMKLQYLFRI